MKSFQSLFYEIRFFYRKHILYHSINVLKLKNHYQSIDVCVKPPDSIMAPRKVEHIVRFVSLNQEMAKYLCFPFITLDYIARVILFYNLDTFACLELHPLP